MDERRFRVHPSAAGAVFREVRAHPANSDSPLSGYARVVRSEVLARVTGRPVQVPLGQGSRIWAHHHRGGSWRVVHANPPDFAEMSAWRRLLRPGDLFVDVGANAGVYSVWALDCGARLIAVEPSGEMVAQLRQNLALNGYVAEVHEAALSSRAGRGKLAGPDLLRQRITDDGPGDDGGVQLLTLDMLLANRPARGVKIDVEGHERLVFEGASEALEQGAVDCYQIEWNSCSLEALGEDRTPVADLLDSAGYVLARPSNDGRWVEVMDSGFGADVFAMTRDLWGQVGTE